MSNGREGLHRFVEEHKRKLELENQKEVEGDQKNPPARRQKVTPPDHMLRQKEVQEHLKAQKEGRQPKRKLIRKKPEKEGQEPDLTPTPSTGTSPFRDSVFDPSGNPSKRTETTQRPPQNKKLFEETHKRFTNYLKIETYQTLQDLRREGHIQSITTLLNDSIEEYLSKYFPKL